ERRTILPGVPDRADGLNIFTHPWPRSRPGHAVAALDMALHLRAKPEREAAVREFLQRPGAESGDRRAAREGDGDRGGALEPRRRWGSERHQNERIVFGLLKDNAVVTEPFEEPRIAPNCAEIERHLRCAQAGVGLAQRQQRLDLHRLPPSRGTPLRGG